MKLRLQDNKTLELDTHALRWRNHGLPPLSFAVVAVALSWPLVLDFSSKTLGKANNDVLHHLCFFWHVKEWLLGHEPLFRAPLLYYPVGISVLGHGVGPLLGLVVAPFWAWGPVAALNAAMLIGLWLTGYFMYLLARELGIERKSALFSGILLMIAPIHLAGLYGHVEKVFLGLVPLVIWGLARTLDLRRTPMWAVATAGFLLLTLLHNALQFIMAGAAVVFFGIVALMAAKPGDRGQPAIRLLAVLLSSLVLVGPLLLAIAQTARDPTMDIDFNYMSDAFQPDAIELFLPANYTLLFGDFSTKMINNLGLWSSSIETYVFLSWTGLILSLVAVVAYRRQMTAWLLFTGGWVALCLGPSLQILGQRYFTEYGLPLIMPYSLLTALPGMDFLRTPGRLALMAVVGLSVLAAVGLHTLNARYKRASIPITLLALGLVFVESWPRPWPQDSPPPLSDFYQRLAADKEIYGLFDLPIQPTPDYRYVDYSARYQFYQMVHQKGIASGYLSRVYKEHPVFPCFIPDLRSDTDTLVNGQLVTRLDSALSALSHQNYRYVIVHKPQPGDEEYQEGSWGYRAAKDFVTQVFAEEEPVFTDSYLNAYRIPAPDTIAYSGASICYGYNWYPQESGWRWANSPASLHVFAAKGVQGYLRMKPVMIFDPTSSSPSRGSLLVDVDGRSMGRISIVANQETALGLDLAEGFHTVRLTLEAGSFRPSSQGLADQRLLSFAVAYVDLDIRE